MVNLRPSELFAIFATRLSNQMLVKTHQELNF